MDYIVKCNWLYSENLFGAVRKENMHFVGRVECQPFQRYENSKKSVHYQIYYIKWPHCYFWRSFTCYYTACGQHEAKGSFRLYCHLSIYIYIHICICICACLYMYVHIQTHRAKNSFRANCHLNVYIYTYIYTHIYIHIHIYICVYVYINICTQTELKVPFDPIATWIYTHTYIYI